jgi:hypothetical protein
VFEEGATLSLLTWSPGKQLLYNFDVKPKPDATMVTATPDRVLAGDEVVYEVEVSHSDEDVPTGTVDVTVDGEPVCEGVPLIDGVGGCSAHAPSAPGTYAVEAAYSGDEGFESSTAVASLRVLAKGVSVPGPVGFGTLHAGASAVKAVMLSNSGETRVTVAGAELTGSSAFSIGSDGCAGALLEPGERCSVQVRFAPSGAGSFSGALVFDEASGAGAHSVALSGTAVASAPPPVAPEPTPAPPAARPGGRLVAPVSSKRKVPTLKAARPPAGRPTAPSRLSLPLACPADEPCAIRGRLTAALPARRATAIARFSRVRLSAGGRKTVKVTLSRAFVKAAHAKRIRRVTATLAITTVFGDGQAATTRQRVIIVLPQDKSATKRPRAARLGAR